MKRIKKLLLPVYIILNILLVTIGSYLVMIKKIRIINYSRMYIILLIINVIIIISKYFYDKKKKIKNKIDKLDIIAIIIIVFGLISSIFAINKQSAFFGFKGRYEGLFQIMYYFSIFYLSSLVHIKHKKYIIYSLLFCGAVEGIYAIFQKTQLIPVYTSINNGHRWANGFITNPNFFGTFMLLCLSYSIGLFIDSKNIKNRIVYFLLISLFMTSLLFGNTLSTIIGLIVVLLYLLIYLIINKRYIIFLILLIPIVSITIITTKMKYTGILGDLIKTKNQTVEISKGHVEEKYGSNRIFIWKNTIKRVPLFLLHGVGIDNFYYAFGRRPLSSGYFYYDKAHNEYLQVLICEGMYALVSYIIFYSILLIRGIKNSFKNKKVYLILPVIGYLIQAFFNISVIEVAPFVYISLGLCMERSCIKEVKDK